MLFPVDFDNISALLNSLPTEPGVYQMRDAQETVLYVGKAAHLKKRVSSYFSRQISSTKIRSLVKQIVSIDITVTRSETEALLLESNLIKSLLPKYNVLLRDDKTYPYIHVTNKHAYPRMELYRSKKKPSGSDYFGPFPTTTAVKETLATIQKIFKIRNCRDSYFNARSRPCLQYEIKRCTAPCTQYISEEDYRQSVDQAIQFLQGKSQDIIQLLTARMERAVERLAFEEAAVFRDQIQSLRIVQERQGIVQLQGEADIIVWSIQSGFACLQWVSVRNGQVIANQHFYPKLPPSLFEEEEVDEKVLEAFISYFYLDFPERIPPLILLERKPIDLDLWTEVLSNLRGKKCRIQINPRGGKARWVGFAKDNLQLAVKTYLTATLSLQARYQALQDLLQMTTPIQRMECFDISHTRGEATVASCVVFDNKGPCRAQYRCFNILGVQAGDDYAAMQQVLQRRFSRLKSQAAVLPDVVIIDGGKGQVNIAKQVLEDLNIHTIQLIGVAKGPERKPGLEHLILVAQQTEIDLPSDSHALHLLQHIRDEAHRFAITTHRAKRQKNRFESSLDSIEGVGLKRRQALLRHFGGIQALNKASQEEIAKVAGVSQALAARIYAHFHA